MYRLRRATFRENGEGGREEEKGQVEEGHSVMKGCKDGGMNVTEEPER